MMNRTEFHDALIDLLWAQGMDSDEERKLLVHDAAQRALIAELEKKLTDQSQCCSENEETASRRLDLLRQVDACQVLSHGEGWTEVHVSIKPELLAAIRAEVRAADLNIENNAPRARVAELTARAEKAEAELARVQAPPETAEQHCPQCGPGVHGDEDGCCTMCGSTLCGAWIVDRLVECDRYLALMREWVEADRERGAALEALADADAAAAEASAIETLQRLRAAESALRAAVEEAGKLPPF